jgi:hypothetical protein
MTQVRSRRTIIGGLVFALVLAGAAIAYWTVGGTGTGSGAVGTNSALTAVQTTTLTPMFPGDTPQTLSGTFNNSNTGPAFVNTVTVSIGSVAPAGSGTCDATDFTLANTTMTVNAEVPSGNGVGAWTGATIQFNNKPTVNQDGCKGATVNLIYTIA